MRVIYDKNKQKVPIKIWADNLDDGALQQLIDASNHPAVFHHVSGMPDLHQGYGLPIGGVVALKNAISPYAVGSDIACGLMGVKTFLKKNDINTDYLVKVLREIKKRIVMGPKHHKKESEYRNKLTDELFNKYPNTDLDLFEFKDVASQLGTLGSNNHFIDILTDQDDFIWVLIHSGSRHLGYVTCNKYHKIAVDLNNKYYTPLPTERLAFLPVDSEEGQKYLKSMNFCMDFSYKNRECILSYIKESIEVVHGESINFYGDVINIHHNFVQQENHFGNNVWVHRKGATLARDGTVGIIPGSMGTSSYIVKGRGDAESFSSCSHGAGRTMSRKKAREVLNIDEFKKQMENIVIHIDNGYIEEAPNAYKDINTVMENQKDLVEILYELTPRAVIMDRKKDKYRDC